MYSNETLSWSDAKEFCRSEGGALARAKNGDQWLQMLEAAGPFGPGAFWIDGKKADRDGVFMCSNKETKPGFPCRYLPWAFAEPDDSGEACIGMIRATFTYTLGDGGCDGPLNFMCRFRVN